MFVVGNEQCDNIIYKRICCLTAFCIELIYIYVSGSCGGMIRVECIRCCWCYCSVAGQCVMSFNCIQVKIPLCFQYLINSYRSTRMQFQQMKSVCIIVQFSLKTLSRFKEVEKKRVNIMNIICAILCRFTLLNSSTNNKVQLVLSRKFCGKLQILSKWTAVEIKFSLCMNKLTPSNSHLKNIQCWKRRRPSMITDIVASHCNNLYSSHSFKSCCY